MKFTLMHRDQEAINLDLSPDGTVAGVGRIINPSVMPWGTNRNDPQTLLNEFRSWWSFRHISNNRPFIDERLSTLGIKSPKELMIRFNAVNLSDHYWLRTDERQSWDEVNQFNNEFSESLGKFLLDGKGIVEHPSPESATDGMLPKMWTNDRILLKGGTGFWQQPFNEVIASEMMKRLGIDHVNYSLEFIDGKPYSKCRSFTTECLESIPARCLMHATDYRNRRTMYSHLVESCNLYGVADSVEFINRMITVDCLMGNTDRHYNNFVLLRDSKELKVVGFGPIFDTGSSLGFDLDTNKLNPEKVKGRTFKKDIDKQLCLVTDFNWFNPSSLIGLDDFAYDLLSDSEIKDLVNRADCVSEFLSRRIDIVSEYAEKPHIFIDNREDDIFVD